MPSNSFDAIYSVEQINIPPTFPHILKLFAKAAIRTQPYDLLRWTSAYFRALTNGEEPPVKERFEYPPFTHPTGLTPRYLKTLLNQLGRTNSGSSIATNTVALKTLLDCWQGIVLSETVLYQILMIGHLLNDDQHYELDLYRFLAVACGVISNNLLETMIKVCELFTDEPGGGSAMIPLKTFLNLYGYLAKLNCSSEQFIAETLSSQNVEIAPESSIEISSLSNVKKNSLLNCSISMEDLKWVCIYGENDKSFCDSISNESSEYCMTTVSDHKTNNDSIICQDNPGVDDMEKAHQPLVEDETSIKFFTTKEVTGVQDESLVDIDEHFNDISLVETSEAMADEYVGINENQVSPSDVVELPMILDSLTVTKVTNETSELEMFVEDITGDLLASVGKSQMPIFQVGSGDTVDVGESKTNVGDNVELLEMVNEVDDAENVLKHIVIATMKMEDTKLRQKIKHNATLSDIKGICEKMCKCDDESKWMKQMWRSETGHVQLPSSDEEASGMIASHDKVAEFIRNMRGETHPYANYDVAGIGAAVSDERITKVGLWLTECSRQQGGHVGPRNLRHFLCPSLHDDYDDVNNPRGTETN